jgi:hypothetical protein
MGKTLMAAGKRKRIITTSIDYPKAEEISPQMESLLRPQAMQMELLSTLMPVRFAMKQTPMQLLYRAVTISHVLNAQLDVNAVLCAEFPSMISLRSTKTDEILCNKCSTCPFYLFYCD